MHCLHHFIFIFLLSHTVKCRAKLNFPYLFQPPTNHTHTHKYCHIIYVQQFSFMAVCLISDLGSNSGQFLWDLYRTKSNGTLHLQTLQFPLSDSHFNKFSISLIYHHGMGEWTILIKYQGTQAHSHLQMEI
jgi:hypothetical protein